MEMDMEEKKYDEMFPDEEIKPVTVLRKGNIEEKKEKKPKEEEKPEVEAKPPKKKEDTKKDEINKLYEDICKLFDVIKAGVESGNVHSSWKLFESVKNRYRKLFL